MSIGYTNITYNYKKDSPRKGRKDSRGGLQEISF